MLKANKSAVALILALAMLITAASSVWALPEGSPWDAAAASPRGEAIVSGGLVLDGHSQRYFDYGQLPATNALLPEAFDLREQGLATPVKDQNPWGSCWAFGTLATAEGNLLTQGAGSYDLSERHLAWFAYQSELEGPQAGEGLDTNGENPFDLGGNIFRAMRVLANWQGAASEEQVPYQDNEGTQDGKKDWSVDESHRYDSVARLTDAQLLPSPSNIMEVMVGLEPEYEYNPAATEAIKQALMETGVVNISYHADVSRPGETGDGAYFNYHTWSQYVDELILDPDREDNTIPNHQVSVVGWDDHYSKDNFNADRQPPENGAWIVKNSWGAGDWGVDDSGYFYLSYYDQSLSEIAALVMDGGQDGFDYDNNYQHDYLGAASPLDVNLPSEAGVFSIANIFESGGGYERLDAVSAMVQAPMTQVKAEVYLLPQGSNDPYEGELAASVEDSFVYNGYYTIELPEPVILPPGSRFAVVETILSGDGKYYLPMEYGEPLGAYDVDYTAKINPGESLIYDEEGGWVDLYEDPLGIGGDLMPGGTGGNAMIKAFTNDLDVQIPELTSLEVSAYDAAGERIDFAQYTPQDGATITLPEATHHAVMIPKLSSPDGNAELMIDGTAYEINGDIPREVLSTGAQVAVSTLANMEGIPGLDYVFEVEAIGDTVLESGGVALVDNAGVLPEGTVMNLTQVAQGEDFDLVAAALKAQGREKKFTLMQVETLYNGAPYVLNEGEGVALRFDLPKGYSKAGTQLYRVEIENGKAVLYPATREENAALALNTGAINGYFVLAQKNSAPVVSGGGSQIGDGDFDFSFDLPFADGSSQSGDKTSPQTGDGFAPISLAVAGGALLIISGVWAARSRKK